MIVVEKYPLQTEKLLCSKYNDISLNTPVPNMKKKKKIIILSKIKNFTLNKSLPYKIKTEKIISNIFILIIIFPAIKLIGIKANNKLKKFTLENFK